MPTTETNELREVELQESTASDLIPVMMRFLHVVRRRKRVVFSVLYCFALVGGAYYFLAPRKYESSAKLLIVEQKLDHLSTVGEHDATGNTMATHRELVTSPVVIQQAIKLLPKEYRVDLHGKPVKEWVNIIAGNLSARITRKTNIIDVSYRSSTPDAAAAVVRSVIQSYLDFVAKNHKGAAGEIITILTDERDQLQIQLDEKQKELQKFSQQAGHLAISTEEGVVEPMIQRAIQLNDAMIDAQQKRLELQATLASVEDSLSRGEDISQHLMSIEATLGRQILLASMGLSPQDMQVLSEQQKKHFALQQELNSLSASYGPNHPRILQLQQETATIEQYLSNYHSGAGQRYESMGEAVPSEVIVNMLRQSVRQALKKENQLRTSFDLAREEAAKHSDAIVKLKMLERDVARKETLYDSLSERIASFDLGQIQAPIKATVVREPLPNDLPVTPKLRMVAAFCLFGGTFLGCLIVYVQDILDDRFNSPEEMTSQLGVPILSMVRNLDPLPGKGFETVYTHVMPNSVETEAFRTLRTALALSGEECDRILVSSSEPGDGKTTISANLSVALAHAGKRTLVIDADLRRPGFTTLIDLKGRPGVADILISDQAPADSAPPLVHHTEVDGLDVLPVGLRRPNPSELLSSNAFCRTIGLG